MGCLSNPRANVLWRVIWKMEIMHKVKVFMWRACCEGLPCASELVGRKVLDNAHCSLCERGEETGLHALWQCLNLKSVWKQAEFYSILKVRQFGTFVDMCR